MFTVTFSRGRFNNLETEPSKASGVCVGPISSAESAVTLAKKFMGSKVLWAMKGALYVRSIILAAFLKAASGFPSFLLSITSPDTKAFSSLFTCIAELSNSPVVSQLAFRAFLACINSQVESPTMAINCLKPFSSNPPGSSTVVSTIKASLTPGMLFISASLKSLTVMPKAGGC